MLNHPEHQLHSVHRLRDSSRVYTNAEPSRTPTPQCSQTQGQVQIGTHKIMLKHPEHQLHSVHGLRANGHTQMLNHPEHELHSVPRLRNTQMHDLREHWTPKQHNKAAQPNKQMNVLYPIFHCLIVCCFVAWKRGLPRKFASCVLS